MLFDSFQFLFFFLAVTTLYFVLPFRVRWFLLLISSCYFYMAFVPIYILILIFTIIIDYFAGIFIEGASGAKRKFFLICSLVANIGVLSFFKYYNFLSQNLNFLFHSFGLTTSVPYLQILLPIGLSFHTFQAMSYTIEVYRGHEAAEKNFGIYSLYVMFYPQLVAGPIERPQNLLHQFRTKYPFDYDRIADGLKMILWGFFKKIVIADRLAIYVNATYNHPQEHTGLTLTLATFFFAFQIYCDFSGYSDIAIGSAKVMGFKLMTNFNRPYFAKNISEFWKRWHISLSTWFRDYLYIPLGGNRVARPRLYANLLVTFLVSGLWHGARWTFVVWGALHGAYLIVSLATGPVRARARASLGLARHPALLAAWQTSVVFTLVTLGWVFFRATSLGDAWYVLTHLGAGLGGQLAAVAAREPAATRDLLFLGFEPSRLVLATAAV